MSNTDVSDAVVEHHNFICGLRQYIGSRDYQGAKSATQSFQLSLASQAQQRQNELLMAQMQEQQRLQKAKDIALRTAHTTSAARVTDLADKLDARKREIEAVHHEKLGIYESLLRQREEHRPLVLSTYVKNLRQSERQLAQLHLFDEASLAQRKLISREAIETKRLERQRDHHIEQLIEAKRHQYLDEQHTLNTKMRNELRIANDRAHAELQRTERMFDHFERDLGNAQSKDRYAAALASLPKLGSSGSGASQKCRSARGTTLLRRVRGDRFAIPSLCDIYGGLLDSGTTTRATTAGTYTRN